MHKKSVPIRDLRLHCMLAWIKWLMAIIKGDALELLLSASSEPTEFSIETIDDVENIGVIYAVICFYFSLIL